MHFSSTRETRSSAHAGFCLRCGGVRLLLVWVADRVPLSVIATGGSAVHSDTLRAYLANHPNVVVVWLKQDSEDKQQTDWSANWVGQRGGGAYGERA